MANANLIGAPESVDHPITDPVRFPARKPRPRLDVLSEGWLRNYRTLAAVRPNATGTALAAEVERLVTGDGNGWQHATATGLPHRDDRHQRDGRRPQPQTGRPHPQQAVAA